MTDSSKNNSENPDKNSYRNIIKGSSFFGGVQIFNIIISLIRGKFVALILGPEGMGISALFTSSSNTLQRFASLGLNQSIVREVASDTINEETKENQIRASLLSTNLTALFGFLLCVAFCVPLSRVTFGDTSYWWQFMILAPGIWFAISGTGKLSVLQGLHEVKRISRASIIGGLAGLFIGVPLYYIFGDKGIVPAIVAIFLSLYIFYTISLKRSFQFKLGKEKWKKYLPLIKSLLSLGIVLMAGELISTLVGYVVNLFVRIYGSIDDVGLYQAANSVTNQFSGVVFAVLSMEYFPRLANVANDNLKMKGVVNQESEIVSWLITPAMSILILTTPLLIRILLSTEFLTITPLMKWMGLGMMIRAFSFPMAYITYAKGNKKVFLLMEGVVANLMTLILSCIFYYKFGLIGLGYALVADNFFCFFLYYAVNRRLYSYSFNKVAGMTYLIGLILVGLCFGASFFESQALAYSFMGVLTAGAIVWSVVNLKLKLSERTTN